MPNLIVGISSALVVAMAFATNSCSIAEVFWAVPLLAILQFWWWHAAGKSDTVKCLRSMLLGATVCHVAFIAFANPLFTSDDINRYVFEGHVVRNGGNPYRHAPASPLFDRLTQREGLEDLRDGVNNPQIATIYPPVAEWLFAFGTFIEKGLRGWLVVTLLLDLALLWLLPVLLSRYGRDPRWSVVYAFHPVILLEGLGGGHVDLVAVAFLSFAILLADRKRALLSWALMSLSVLAKVVSLVVSFSMLKKLGFRALTPAVFISLFVLSTVLWINKSGTIEPEFSRGRWQVFNQSSEQNNVKFASTAEKLIRGDDSLPHKNEINASGNFVATLIGKGVSSNDFELLGFAFKDDLKISTSLQHNDILGQYRLYGNGFLRTQSNQLSYQTIRFDGQGRLAGDFEGYYWVHEENSLMIQRDGTILGPFRFSTDLSVGLNEDGLKKFYLAKFDEKPGMGLRHYGSRWTANAPLFRFLKSLVRGDDEYDRKRKLVQLFSAILLIALALYLYWHSTALPEAALILLFVLWLTAPAIYPWYLLWLIPFLGFSNSKVPLMWTYTCLAMHLPNELVNHEFLVYIPPATIFLYELFSLFRKPRLA